MLKYYVYIKIVDVDHYCNVALVTILLECYRYIDFYSLLYIAY